MRAKAFLTVSAGVIPGEAMPEYGKRWSYTSGDYEKDRQMSPQEPTVFSQMLDDAHDYAKGLTNPAYVNWVRVEWFWT